MNPQSKSHSLNEAFHRDKPTVISYAQAACVGWFFFGSGPAINLLRDDLGVSRTIAATHSVSMATGGVIAGFIAGPFIRRFGRGMLLRTASFVMALGVLLFTIGHHLFVTIPGAFLVTGGGATVVQCTAAFLSQHQKRFAPAAISELHGYAAALGALAPLTIGFCVSHGYGWRITLQALIVVTIMVEIIRGRSVAVYGVKPTSASDFQHHDVKGALPNIFWWSCVAMVCTSGTEASIMLWSSDYLHTRAGLGSGAAAAAVACVVGGMCVARLSGALLTKRWSAETLYVSSLVLSLIGFTGFWLLHSTIGMLIALTITGLGVSLHFPFGIERAMKASGGRPDRASSRVAITTGAAGGAAPFLMGWLADQLGMTIAMSVIPILLLVAIVVARRHPVRFAHQVN